jgi:hypothetical protein
MPILQKRRLDRLGQGNYIPSGAKVDYGRRLTISGSDGERKTKLARYLGQFEFEP